MHRFEQRDHPQPRYEYWGDGVFCLQRFKQRDHRQQCYKHWDYAFAYCSGLSSIVVDASNPAYSSLDGVLYDKAMTVLIQYPGGKSGGFTIPNSVTSIGEMAFLGCTG